MIELKAVATCDRCEVAVEMENVDDINEAERRLTEFADWCRSEDGELVCQACWARWDAKQKPTGSPQEPEQA